MRAYSELTYFLRKSIFVLAAVIIYRSERSARSLWITEGRNALYPPADWVAGRSGGPARPRRPFLLREYTFLERPRLLTLPFPFRFLQGRTSNKS